MSPYYQSALSAKLFRFSLKSKYLQIAGLLAGVAFFCLFTPAARATLLWQTDTSRGTSVFESLEEAPGTISIVNDPLGTFGQVYRYDTWDDSSYAKERCESKGTVTPSGDFRVSVTGEYYIGWREMWNPMPTGGDWVALFQMHGYGPAGQGAPLVLRCVNGDGNLYMQNGVNGADVNFWKTPFKIGVWHSFVLHIKLSTDPTKGYVEIWYDGVRQTFIDGTNHYVCSLVDQKPGSYVEFKWGVYRSATVNGKGPASTFMTDAKLGTTFADVDPLGGGSNPAAAPVFSPAAGTYTSAQSVTLTSATSGAAIRYTTDGSTPSETAGTLYSGTPVSVGSTTTLNAIAYASGFTDSAVTSATYTINLPQQVAAPGFSPGAGTYASAQNVTVTSATSGASIRYTTDGSTPSETAGTLYSGPVSVGISETLKAIAYKGGSIDSTVSSAAYTISVGGVITLEAESLSPVGTGATVSISNDANASGGVVEFLNATATGQAMTLTTPAIAAGTYQVQLRYSANKSRGQHNVKIDGVQIGGTVDQYAATQAYVTAALGNVTLSGSGAHTIVMTVTGKNSAATQFYLTADKFTFTPVSVQPQVAAPTFNPPSGTLPLSVTINTTTASAFIRYTTDGSTPSETAGTIYSGPVNITSTTTLKAIAYEAGFTDSTVTSATYTGIPPPPLNFEAESLSPVGTGATVSTSSDANASGGVVEFLNSTAAGQVMTFPTPSIPAGTYQFQLRYWANTTRGQHTVKIDGTQIGGTIDQYASAKGYVTVTLGSVTFASAGTHTIAMTVTGKNSAATQFYLTADRFSFVGQ
ncbi:MAG TPA: chitobiase/beta-hexosaminidase C-terminal domain-containing protein [Opitutaceae bacterium]|nr:chitobiase/beta-hexosaminidase C-terminal domain-containing protein [Opitutaceae bacterium]